MVIKHNLPYKLPSKRNDSNYINFLHFTIFSIGHKLNADLLSARSGFYKKGDGGWECFRVVI